MTDFYCDQVISGKTPIEIVIETDLVLAFNHTQPYFEHHIVIIPKQHIQSLTSSKTLNPDLAQDFMNVIHKVASLLNEENGGCRVSSNVGNYQTTKHLHWYVHSGKRLRNEDGSLIK
jgi:histidine triad (HIT) family protein